MNDGAFREWIRTLADAEAVIPARVVLDHLPPTVHADAEPIRAEAPDLTIEELGRELHRSPSTIRGWLAADPMPFPDAYRLNGREWRIPRANVAAYLARQRPRMPQDRTEAIETTGDLGSWRKHYQRAL